LKEASDCNVFFLNDWYISLAPFLPRNSYIVIISSGADLHTWCNPKMAESVASVGLFKSLSFMKSKIARVMINNMRKGLACANVVTYFPRGMNIDADCILDECSKGGAKIIRRYDVDTSLVDIEKFSKSNFENDSKFRICSAVRFDYIAEEGAPNNCLKGNDLIIKGIAKFYREVSTDVSVVFFEKGRHVNEAKKLCDECGISGIVEWRKTVPLNELLNIMYYSDVCFDQVGSHWIGAVGVYALLLDKPLIANYSDENFFVSDDGFKPILKSETTEGVYGSLCSVYEGEGGVKNANRNFALSKFGPHRVFQEYKILIDSYFGNSDYR